MAHSFENKLVVGISSRALFDMQESHRVFEEKGLEAYADYQIQNENSPLEPGPAYHLVKKFLSLKGPDDQEPLVEIILLSRNSADTGLRIFNSIKQHQLNITRAAFTNGQSPYHYVSAFNSHLFLSAHSDDVMAALKSGCAAATLIANNKSNTQDQQLRIAFDGDSVLFSDEAERIYQQDGLQAFTENESLSAKIPLSAGPFKGFLTVLHNLQKRFPAENCPLRTALVTARSAPAHERVITTFRAWDIRIDEALFLGGLSKGAFLKAFKADIFFDDQEQHCQSAAEHVAAAHVPNGIVNEKR